MRSDNFSFSSFKIRLAAVDKITGGTLNERMRRKARIRAEIERDFMAMTGQALSFLEIKKMLAAPQS